MKKIFTLICACAVGMTAMAQRQIQNGGFEEWENEGTDLIEPAHWNSFKSASGRLNGQGAKQLDKQEDARPGSAGRYSVRINTRTVFGIPAQGNLTTGRINMGSVTATDATGNYNYTQEDDANFNQPFTGLPDALHLWVKASCSFGGAASCNLHSAGYFQDPAANDIKATLIAKADNSTIANSEEWQEITIPFQYFITDGTRPAYALVTLTTSGQPGKGAASDWMIIDDVEFLYYSDLKSITFNSKEIPVEGTTIKIDGTYDPDLLQLKSGQGASINTSYNEGSKTLTVSIKGEDIAENPNNQHTYILVFSGKENEKPTPEPEPVADDVIGSLVPGGDFEAWKEACGTTHQTGRGGGDFQRPGQEPTEWNGSSLKMNTKFIADSWTTEILVEPSIGYKDEGNAIKLTNKTASYYSNKVTFPGFVTYGDLWSWSGSTSFLNSDMGVYGGREYALRPDAIRGQFKRPEGTNENAHIIAYLWKGTIQGNIGSYDNPTTPVDDLDRAIMGHADATGGEGQLIASCDYTFTSTQGGDWETIVVPFTYVEGQEEAVPEKMNIILSAGEYWERNRQEGSTLEADNIEFLFYSELATATYDGKDIVFDDENNAVIDADYDKNLLNVAANGRSARIVRSYDDKTRTLTIRVKGGDFDINNKNFHLYKVHFLEQHHVVSEKTYTDLMLISINDTPSEPKDASITIQEWNTGEKSLMLPNFVMGEGYNVGTIAVSPIDFKEDGSFTLKQNITILPGDSPADAQWIGPMLGEVPIDVQGVMTEDSLHLRIQIDLVSRINQMVNVVFGKSLIEQDQQSVEPVGPTPGPGAETIVLKGTHTYTDDLVVTLNGETTSPQTTDITVTFNADNTLDLSLKNFRLQQGNENMPVGNIELKNVKFSLRAGVAYATFSKSETISIEAGDDPEDELWMGPVLGNIPVTIAGKAGTDKLYCTIDINMEGIGVIHVDFGNDSDWPEVQGGGDEPKENEILRDYTFTDTIFVTVNGDSSEPQEASVNMVVNEDESVNLTLKDFHLKLQDGSVAPIGDIEVTGIKPVEFPEKDYYLFETEQNLFIKEGSSTDEIWIGPYLGEIPVRMTGKIAAYKLYCTISIYLPDMNENVLVVFGENFTDGINETKALTKEQSIYTLNGVRVNKITKAGLYIINGRKTLVR